MAARAIKTVPQRALTEACGFDALLDEVCITWGFCGGVVRGEHRHVTDYIPKTGIVTVDQFIGWVFEAQGADIKARKWERHKAALREAFIALMGAEAVDAELLRVA